MLLSLSLTVICVAGVYAAFLYGHKTREFHWSEYWALLAAPLGVCAWLIYQNGAKLFYFFLASIVVGFVLEYALGFMYYKTLNQRLWRYSRYDIGGHTSWLTLPMWGVAGVVFWVLSNHFGL